MDQALNPIAIVFLGLAFFLVCGNYFIFFANLSNRRQHTERFISMIPLLAQLFAGIAILMLVRSDPPWIPKWSPGLVALADPAFWEIIYGLVRRK